ncbi:MAG: diphosphate--fructose-6-phosphate 1-phosphotransferase [Thermomicrobiales bacterium]
MARVRRLPLDNLAILQSGGPTSVLNASLVGIIREGRNRFGRILGVRSGFEGLLDDRHFDLTTLSDDQLDRLERTPSAGLGTSRLRPSDDDLVTIAENLRALGCTGLIGIGGNDTAESLDRLARLASETGQKLQVIGLPKTIDNDLAVTDHSLGYASAARYIAAYVRDAQPDTVGMANLYPVKFVEVMGRNAGWLAAASSLWTPGWLPAPIIALPERPFASEDTFLDVIQQRVDEMGGAVIVVPETMRWADGVHVSGSTPEWTDEFGHEYYASAGQTLATVCAQKLGLKAKLDRPGSVSRSSIDYVSTVDFLEASEAGRFAVRAIQEGRSGSCVVIERDSSSPYRSTMNLAPLSAIANVEARLPDHMIDPSGFAVTPSFVDYAAPLVGESTATYELLRWDQEA